MSVVLAVQATFYMEVLVFRLVQVEHTHLIQHVQVSLSCSKNNLISGADYFLIAIKIVHYGCEDSPLFSLIMKVWEILQTSQVLHFY